MELFFTVIFSIIACTLSVSAAEAPIKNAGFVPANIWYSQEPFFSGDEIRIYTVIFNGSSEDLVGTVEFFDNGVSINTTDFSLASGGRVRDVWVDWVAHDGKHTITARLVDVYAVGVGGKKRAIVLENAETGKSERVIDLDTDSDKVGNTDDLDDDNDSIPDIDEVQNGTDPLKKDSDGNGISDSDELALAKTRVLLAEKSTSTSTGDVGVVRNTLQSMDEKIPQPVKEAFLTGSNSIERFRISEGYQFRLAKEEKAKEIDARAARARMLAAKGELPKKNEGIASTVSSATEKPFAYATFAILALIQYFFEWKIVFYTVSLYVIYRLIRWVVQYVRNR